MDLISCHGSIVPKLASCLAALYAAFVLYGFWNKKFIAKGSTNGELSRAGKVHVLLWTMGPPIWFFGEYWIASTYACPYDQEALANVKLWQDMAKTFWAGILAAVLFLKGK